jgi:hypothetical protein
MVAPSSPGQRRGPAGGRTIVEVPNQPGEREDSFREDLAFAQGTLHLVTTNLDFAFNVIAQSVAG